MATGGSGLIRSEAYVTLATNDAYSLGALVLGHSLRKSGTQRQLAILITSGVSQSIRHQLTEVFDVLQEVDVLDSRDTANLALLTRPDLGITFTKLHCWRLTQYQKCVFMDADTLVIQNIDDLFNREELSAAPDVGWPDFFNSGVFVYVPSEATYLSLLNFALTRGSFDGGDQGLLNLYFRDWATKDIHKHLPFTYNVVSQAFYTYRPALNLLHKDVKVVHFLGGVKPWQHFYNPVTRQVEPQTEMGLTTEFLQIWWDNFMIQVQPHLQADLKGIVGQLASLSVDVTVTPEKLDDRRRQLSWESGRIDYMGADAFANIQKKIDESMSSKKEESTSSKKTEAKSSKKTESTSSKKTGKE